MPWLKVNVGILMRNFLHFGRSFESFLILHKKKEIYFLCHPSFENFAQTKKKEKYLSCIARITIYIFLLSENIYLRNNNNSA